MNASPDDKNANRKIGDGKWIGQSSNAEELKKYIMFAYENSRESEKQLRCVCVCVWGGGVFRE